MSNYGPGNPRIIGNNPPYQHYNEGCPPYPTQQTAYATNTNQAYYANPAAPPQCQYYGNAAPHPNYGTAAAGSYYPNQYQQPPLYFNPPPSYDQTAYALPQQQPPPPVTSNSDADWGISDGKLVNDELDISIRHAFIRKVYSILTIQLFITFGLASLFVFFEPAKHFLIKHWWIGLIVIVVTFVATIALVCCPSVGRTFPLNYIMLLLLALAIGILLGYASIRVKSISFALAAGITAAVTLALTLFAFQTRWDFTGCGIFVFVLGIVMMIFAIIAIFLHNKIFHLIYASIGALIASFYIVYDTQLIVGGKHRKCQFSIDDYAFAAFSLYMDIINLFLYILSLISATGED